VFCAEIRRKLAREFVDRHTEPRAGSDDPGDVETVVEPREVRQLTELAFHLRQSLAPRAQLIGVVVPEDDARLASIGKRQLDVLLLPVAGDRRFDAAARRRFLNEPRELARAADVLSVERHDDVAALEAGFLGGTLGPDIFNLHAPGLAVDDAHAELAA